MTCDQFLAWRKRLRFTQAKAALLLGLSKSTIERYESGFLEIPRSVALACAAIALGLTDYPDSTGLVQHVVNPIVSSGGTI